MIKKQIEKKKKLGLFVGLVFIIIILIAVFIYIDNNNKEEELEKIYASFKVCPSCTETLKSNDEFATEGKRNQLKEFQDKGYSGKELFYEGVNLLGIGNIADKNLKLQTIKKFENMSNESRAILELKENYINFGNISESEDSFVMKEFVLKNTGTKDLYIYEVGTSCSCLTTKLIDNEKESPSMGRFSYPYGMSVKIEPGESKRLRVTYDARVNSFFRGFETRFVYIHSNDVQNYVQQITVDVTHLD